MKTIDIKTHAKEEFIDITPVVRKEVHPSGIKNGTCFVFVPHTTAAVTINENADADVKADILMALKKLVPDSLAFRHSEGNSAAHVKASFIGSSITIIIEQGELQLGTWQGIYFCEFDGPRQRKVFIEISSL